MPLNVVRRKQTQALTISGVVTRRDGTKLRVQRRAQSDDPDLAAEEARAIEAELLRRDWSQTPMALTDETHSAVLDALTALDLTIREMRSEMRENLRILREHVSSEMRANARLAEERERIIKNWLDRYENVMVAAQTATVSTSTAASLPPSRSKQPASVEKLLQEARGRRPTHLRPQG